MHWLFILIIHHFLQVKILNLHLHWPNQNIPLYLLIFYPRFWPLRIFSLTCCEGTFALGEIDPPANLLGITFFGGLVWPWLPSSCVCAYVRVCVCVCVWVWVSDPPPDCLLLSTGLHLHPGLHDAWPYMIPIPAHRPNDNCSCNSALWPPRHCFRIIIFNNPFANKMMLHPNPPFQSPEDITDAVLLIYFCKIMLSPMNAKHPPSTSISMNAVNVF